MQKGGWSKTPGREGIGRAFFTETWEELRKDWLELCLEMFDRLRLVDQQKHGMIVCIRKTGRSRGPRDYRSITLLNTDYKIFARILAWRVQEVLGDSLHLNQYCWTPGKSTFDAVATVKDAITYS
jgi:hypothetical protein